MIPASTSPVSWQLLREAFLKALPADAVAKVGVVVGCSGGADSVALTCLVAEHWHSCQLASEQLPPLRIAHFNHALRGDSSDADERFVRDLAASLGVEIEVGRASPGKMGDAEATLRQDRRQFFHDVAARSGCRYVALAHTADDQAETILHHLLRGTGSLGLAGMRPASPLGRDFVMLRPLLHIGRVTLRRAIAERGQQWREDASNRSTRYTRNWLRHDVLPLIHTRFPQADQALSRAAETQNQLGEMLTGLATQWLDAFVELPLTAASKQLNIRRPGANRGVNFPCVWPHAAELAHEHAIIIAACQIAFDAIGWPRRDMNHSHWDRLAEAIATSAGPAATMLGNAPVLLGNAPVLLGHSPLSLGHWPGHVEGLQTADRVILKPASRS